MATNLPRLASVVSTQMSSNDKSLIKMIEEKTDCEEITMQIEKVCAHKMSSINHVTTQTHCALFMALKIRRLKVIELLLERGADVFVGRNPEWIPLVFCLTSYHSSVAVNPKEQEAIQLKIIKYGFSENTLEKMKGSFWRGKKIEMCLHHSLSNCTANVSTLLFKYGAYFGHINSQGYTPLHYAISRLPYQGNKNACEQMLIFLDGLKDDQILWILNTNGKRQVSSTFVCRKGGFTIFEFLLLDILPEMKRQLESRESDKEVQPRAIGTMGMIQERSKQMYDERKIAITYTEDVFIPYLWHEMVLKNGYIEIVSCGWWGWKKKSNGKINYLHLLDESVFRMILLFYENCFSHKEMLACVGSLKSKNNKKVL